MRILILSFTFLSLSSCFQKTTKLGSKPTDMPVVAIQTLGKVEPAYIKAAKFALDSIYDINVVVLPNKQLPREAFVNVKVPRYRADKLISILRSTKPDTIDYVIGLTVSDISTTKNKEPKSTYADWGIFGLGYCPGASCIISTHRLVNADALLLKSRIMKVTVHEFGHNLGLPHCSNKGCVMSDAVETIKTVDYENLTLCNKCRNQISD